MQPTVGRIVHFNIIEDGKPNKKAALITDVKYPEEGGNPQVLLTVFTNTGAQVISWIDKQGDDEGHWNFVQIV